MTLHTEALRFVDAGIAVARAWGLRASVGRGEVCGCNGPGGVCRLGAPGAHPLHDRPSLTATTDPAILAGWAVDHPGENLLAQTGERSRLIAIRFANSRARRRKKFEFGELPPTIATRAPDGAETRFFRLRNPPHVAPDALGRGVTVLAEGGWTSVPGSALPGGLVTWAALPDEGFADLPAPWRDAIRDKRTGTPSVRLFAHA